VRRGPERCRGAGLADARGEVVEVDAVGRGDELGPVVGVVDGVEADEGVEVDDAAGLLFGDLPERDP
jgi:hypothetical protein